MIQKEENTLLQKQGLESRAEADERRRVYLTPTAVLRPYASSPRNREAHWWLVMAVVPESESISTVSIPAGNANSL